MLAVATTAGTVRIWKLRPSHVDNVGVNSLTFSPDGEPPSAINANPNKDPASCFACAQRLPVAVMVTCFGAVRMLRLLASGCVEGLYDRPVVGKLRVVAVMLICFYAHHNRYA
jgi:hypothetical protein